MDRLCNSMNDVVRGQKYKTLVIGEKRYNVPLNLLMQRSGYFKSMFGGEFKECHEQEVLVQLPFDEVSNEIVWFLQIGKNQKKKSFTRGTK